MRDRQREGERERWRERGREASLVSLLLLRTPILCDYGPTLNITSFKPLSANVAALGFRASVYELSVQFSSVQLLSRVRLFATA